MRKKGWDGYSRDTSSARRCLAIRGVRPYTTNAKKNETMGGMRRWSETLGPLGVRRCSGVRPSFDPNLDETLFSTARLQGKSHVFAAALMWGCTSDCLSWLGPTG